jgi:signal peptidase I
VGPVRLVRALLGIATLVGAIVILLGVLLVTHVVRLYRIPASSMEPTLHCGPKPASACEASTSDRVAVFSYVLSEPGRGDIVAFRAGARAAFMCGSGAVYIERIVGLPGDTWAERKGFVYIDGRKLAEPYVPAGERDSSSYSARRLRAGQYYLLGDNRAGSCDSRRFGAVPRKRLLGKVIATYWPPGRVSVG